MRKTSDIIWQDTQHQLLFEILDDIREPTADRKILLKLCDYTEFHFALEERYMEVLDSLTVAARAVFLSRSSLFAW